MVIGYFTFFFSLITFIRPLLGYLDRLIQLSILTGRRFSFIIPDLPGEQLEKYSCDRV